MGLTHPHLAMQVLHLALVASGLGCIILAIAWLPKLLLQVLA